MKFLTTHVGSLPGPETFSATAEHDEASLRGAVEWVVARQREAGLDIINEGELAKGGDWLSFMDARLGGFEERPFPPGGSVLCAGQGPRSLCRFLPLRRRTPHVVLRTRRSHQGRATVYG